MRLTTILSLFLASLFLAACEQGANTLEAGQVAPDNPEGGTSVQGNIDDTQGSTSVEAGGVEDEQGATSVEGEVEN